FVDLSVQRLVFEGGSGIGLHEHLHVGVLDDLVAGLWAIGQRQCQPATAVLRCDAQTSFRRQPGPVGQVADSSYCLITKRKHAVRLTSDGWMTNGCRCAQRHDLQQNTCRACPAGRGTGPRPPTVALTTSRAAAPLFPLPAVGGQTSDDELFIAWRHASATERFIPRGRGRPRARYRMVAAWLVRPCFSR